MAQLKRQIGLMCPLVALMALLVFVRDGRVNEARGELAALQQRAGNVRCQIEMIPPLEKQMADLMIKKRIDGELGSRTDCTAMLAELCRILPANVALVSLEMKPVEIRLTADEGGRSGGVRRASAGSGARSPTVVKRIRVVITGLAPTDVDVANFIGQLSASCLFEGVDMGYVRAVDIQKRTAREFQTSCYLVK